MKRIVSILVVLALCGGCSDTQQSQTAMDFLRQGKAKGELTLTGGGSPAAVGMKQTFFLGPENATLNFHGSIDYSNADGVITVLPSQAAKLEDPTEVSTNGAT